MALSAQERDCLQWLHVNVVQSRAAGLSSEQRAVLVRAISGDAVRCCGSSAFLRICVRCGRFVSVSPNFRLSEACAYRHGVWRDDCTR
jgi:hypothetical protein